MKKEFTEIAYTFISIILNNMFEILVVAYLALIFIALCKIIDILNKKIKK